MFSLGSIFVQGQREFIFVQDHSRTAHISGIVVTCKGLQYILKTDFSIGSISISQGPNPELLKAPI